MATRKKAEEPAVDDRGEMALDLDGQTYRLRPSYDAIRKIENSLRPLGLLTADANRRELTIADMAVITAEFMHAYGAANPEDPLVTDYRGAKPETLEGMIYEAGAPKINDRLLVVLLGALTGGYTASGEVKPATGKRAAPAAG